MALENSSRGQLDQLLSEAPDVARVRAATAFDRLRAPGSDRLVLFGAGGLGRRVLAGLRLRGIEPAAFADNDRSVWGTTIEGVPVLPPEEAARRHGRDSTFVVTIWRAGGTHRFDRTQAQLRALRVSAVAHAGHLFWKYPEVFLPYYAMDLPHRVLEQGDAVLAAFDLLADDASRRHYVEQVRWRLHLDFAGLSAPGRESQYFPPEVVAWSKDEVFIDVGAFDGDTVREIARLFGPAFQRVVALEPDPLNYQRLGASVGSLPPEVRRRVETHPVAVSDTPGKLRITATGLPSSITGSGDQEVQAVVLDDFLAGRGICPTFVKMDIEGAEVAGLRGCRETIRRHRPVLAICAYHVQNHLWTIPLLIHGLHQDYRFFFRPHNEEVWDLVCYAIPAERLVGRSDG